MLKLCTLKSKRKKNLKTKKLTLYLQQSLVNLRATLSELCVLCRKSIPLYVCVQISSLRKGSRDWLQETDYLNY